MTYRETLRKFQAQSIREKQGLRQEPTAGTPLQRAIARFIRDKLFTKGRVERHLDAAEIEGLVLIALDTYERAKKKPSSPKLGGR